MGSERYMRGEIECFISIRNRCGVGTVQSSLMGLPFKCILLMGRIKKILSLLSRCNQTVHEGNCYLIDEESLVYICGRISNDLIIERPAYCEIRYFQKKATVHRKRHGGRWSRLAYIFSQRQGSPISWSRIQEWGDHSSLCASVQI